MTRPPFLLPSSRVPYWPNLAEVGECRSLLVASMPGSFLRAREGVWRGRGQTSGSGTQMGIGSSVWAVYLQGAVCWENSQRSGSLGLSAWASPIFWRRI